MGSIETLLLFLAVIILYTLGVSVARLNDNISKLWERVSAIAEDANHIRWAVYGGPIGYEESNVGRWYEEHSPIQELVEKVAAIKAETSAIRRKLGARRSDSDDDEDGEYDND